MQNPLLRLDELSRRSWMARAAKTLFGVGLLPQIFPTRAFSAAVSAASGTAGKPTAKNVIYLYMAGGQSHIDTWDPKQGEVAGPTKTIKTSVDGIQVSEYLPKTAKCMHLGTIIRSMSSNQGAHAPGDYFMHTSYEQRGTIVHPTMGAWLSHFQGPGNPTLPASVYIGGGSNHPGGGFFPAKDVPLFISNPNNGLKNLELQKGLSAEKHLERMKLALALDDPFHAQYKSNNVSAYREMYNGAYKMMKSADLVAFDITKESQEVRNKYGSDLFGQGCLLARRLVEHGVRFVEVSLSGWDTHVNNFIKTQELCDAFDAGLSALLNDLQQRGMLKETMVVVASEFGRTPAINAGLGRDHNPAAFSCAMFGGGVKGGNIHGSTDSSGGKVEAGKVSIPDFNATIGYALGLPVQGVVMSPSGRPFTLADKGKPVTQLFA